MLTVAQTCPRHFAELLVIGGLALSACDRATTPPPAAEPAAAPAPAKSATPPLPPPPIGRAELLQAIDTARSSYAAGQPDVAAELAGRRFAIRQAFGCVGASEAGVSAGASIVPGVPKWTWGRERRTIEISLTPADWTAAPVVAESGAAWEAVEGYWLTRPWLRTEQCAAAVGRPVAPDDGAAGVATSLTAGPSTQISGLAAVFAPESSRVDRRDGKAFATTLRDDPPLAPPPKGYRLVIEGRFSSFPDGRTIRCHSTSTDAAPVCIAAAEVDRVAFEDADGKLLKEWLIG